MKIVIIFLLVLLNSIAINKNHIVLKLRNKHSFEFAGYYMAKEKGFYKKNGLNVDIQELKNGENIVSQVLYGKADFGIGSSSLVYSKLLGNPIKLLMPIFKNSLLALLTINQNIKSIHDIKNRSIMANPTNLQNISLLSMLQISDIKPDNISIRENIFNADDILKGKADLYLVFLYNQPYYLKEKNISYTIFYPGKFGLDFYGDILFTSKNEILKSPKIIQTFMDATKKGWNYALTHPSETIHIIKTKYNSQNFSTDALKYQASIFKDIISKDFVFDKSKIMEAERIYKILFKNSNTIDYENFIFNPLITNKKERNFIKNHKIAYISTGNWAPFNLIKNGKLAGIALDYWDIIKKKLGLKGEQIIAKNFSQVLNAIKEKKADMTASTAKTKEREKYAVFSKPYAKFPIVIVAKNNTGFIPDINSIKDKLFALPKDYTFSKILLHDYPDINYVEVENIDQALDFVSKGKADITIGMLPVVVYKINDLKYTNLKISGTSKYIFPIRFMIRKDYNVLIPVINRVIDSMKESEKEKIYKKWITVHMQEGYSKEKVVKYSIVVIVIFILLLFWMITLYIQIQKRKKAEKALEKLATMDKLTSIYNRYMIDNSLSEQIEIAKRYKKNLSVVFFDIDHFKKVNDIYGHKIGDTVLKKLSNLVQNKKRKSDIFGRWGGEEFVLILPETDINQAKLIAQNLRIEVEKYYFDKIGHITCSFGVTEIIKNETIDTLMKRVDDALYKAKKEGRNRVAIKS